MVRHLLAALALAAIALTAGATSARAHAVVERADPPAYRLVLKPPESLTLVFSEPIDQGRTEIRVLDQEGRAIGQGAVLVAPDRRQVRLPVRLPGPGIYTVAWKTLSLVDQHTYEGFYTITVGPLRPGAFTLRAGMPTGPSPWEVVFRWLTFLGVAALGGGFLIHRFFFVPALGPNPQGPNSPWMRSLERRRLAATWLGAAAVLVGSAGELAFQAIQAGKASGEAFLPSLLLVATGEPVRTSLLLKIAVPLVLLLALPRRGPAPMLLVLLGLLPSGISLTSHAAATGWVLPLAADWLHLTSAALWVGGLLYLAGVLGPCLAHLEARERTALLGALVPRFSNLAVASVAVLVLTGAYATWVNIPDVRAVGTTSYGRTLAVKLVLLVPLLALAAVNLFSMRPRLAEAARSGDPSSAALPPQRKFLRLVTSEVVVASAVFLAAAILVLLPTSRQVRALTPFGQAFVLVRPAGDLTGRLRIDPYQVGENAFELSLQDREGSPVRDAHVRFMFRPVIESLGAAGAEAVDLGDGRFVLKGPYIGTRGPWMITITARLRGREDVQFAFFVEPDWERGRAPVSATQLAAIAQLKRADEAMNRLTSMRQRQELTDGRGSNVTTLSEFAAPDAMRFQVIGGLEGVLIGEKRFLNDGGAWRGLELLDTQFRFPRYTFAQNAESVVFGPKELVNDLPTQALVLILRSAGAKARYAVWVDEKTSRIVREAMAAPGHYMLSHNYDFNAPVKITPPGPR